ncbi:hypothetical protein SAY87_001796 [Trapa incisa]|uniref:DNA topoisomerase VI subunit B transducer domain-containing protein n=2 Tax=Magnoliopsida TaxID=3398 RepID=A0AAN7PSW7_9MYRT|nr:hypothetical protein SAY87_001796 [Trapa incisa]
MASLISKKMMSHSLLPFLHLFIGPLLVGVLAAGQEDSFYPKSYDSITLNRSSFPGGFFFGTASASYQYEGAANVDGRGPSIWDTFTHKYPEKIADRSNGDVAVDSYDKYKEDVGIMKDMGLDAYRFSISWSRILPKGKLSGGVNRKGVEYYNNLINELLAHGIQPYVTLFHWDLPQVLEDEYGGFLSPLVASQKGKIGITLVSHWFEPYSNAIHDRNAAIRALDFMLGWFLDPIVNGDYPHSMRSLVGSRLPRFSKEQSAMLKGSMDFLGLNYYTANYAHYAPYANSLHASYSTDARANLTTARNGIPIGPRAASSWLFVYPKGIWNMLMHVKNKYGNPLIYITENGISEFNNHTLPLEQQLADPMRIDYYYRHLWYIRKAIKEDGANVRGYFAWSLLDNFEWSDGYTVRFGINYVDYKDGLKRKNVTIKFARRTDVMPPVPIETKHHPSSVDLLLIKRLIAETSKQNLLQFLQHEFVNIGKSYAERLIGEMGPDFSPKMAVKSLTDQQIVRIHQLFRQAKFDDPSGECLSPAGEYNLRLGIIKELHPDLVAIHSGSAQVFEGHPFIVEAGVSMGGKDVKLGLNIFRFANRIPLLFEQGADVVTRTAIKRINYKINQWQDKIGVFVSIVSTKIPFKGTGKEYIGDDINEIASAVKSAIQQCCIQLRTKIVKKIQAREQQERKRNLSKYIPRATGAIYDVLKEMAQSRASKRKRFESEDAKLLSEVSARSITKDTLSEKLAQHVEQVDYEMALEYATQSGVSEEPRENIFIQALEANHQFIDITSPIFVFRLIS